MRAFIFVMAVIVSWLLFNGELGVSMVSIGLSIAVYWLTYKH